MFYFTSNTSFFSRCYYIALSFMGSQKWAESMALFQRVVVYANKAKKDKLLDGKKVQSQICIIGDSTSTVIVNTIISDIPKLI